MTPKTDTGELQLGQLALRICPVRFFGQRYVCFEGNMLQLVSLGPRGELHGFILLPAPGANARYLLSI